MRNRGFDDGRVRQPLPHRRIVEMEHEVIAMGRATESAAVLGTGTKAWQFGHRIFLPAALSATFSFWLQPGHWMYIASPSPQLSRAMHHLPLCFSRFTVAACQSTRRSCVPRRIYDT